MTDFIQEMTQTRRVLVE